MNHTNRPRIVIIGGGISGLTAAYQLTRCASHQSPLEVLLLEASARLGGALRT
ncbi:MAG: FAD-dependent oxidoreductase, partial [Acidobacteria bacterium]|nr:FAD-dependent oxidoreductase [Acidobacteriota bacterium]